MSKGIRRQLHAAMEKVRSDIECSTDRSNKYAIALAYEGYKGGYLHALQDVLQALDGLQPNTRGYWNIPIRSRRLAKEEIGGRK